MFHFSPKQKFFLRKAKYSPEADRNSKLWPKILKKKSNNTVKLRRVRNASFFIETLIF